MFALRDQQDRWVTSKRTGKRMVWTSRKLAHLAAKHIGKDRKIVCRVVEA